MSPDDLDNAASLVASGAVTLGVLAPYGFAVAAGLKLAAVLIRLDDSGPITVERIESAVAAIGRVHDEWRAEIERT